jgi:DNA-binding NarL/FixJ family response regulator
MNAEIRIGRSLGYEFQRTQREPVRPYSGPMIQPPQRPPKPLFSAREMDLMSELLSGGGDANKDIAFRLGLTEATTKVYFCKLLTKLNLCSRTALALYAERSGMFLRMRSELPSLVDPAEAA